MAHGRPDYGLGGVKATTYVLDDMRELANRLGGIISIDGLGDVILLDGFEAANINKCATATVGVGSAVALDATIARTGENSVKLTTGAAAGAIARLDYVLAVPVPSRVGIESWLAFASDIKEFRVTIYYYTGTLLYSPALRIEPALDRIRLVHAGGTTTISNASKLVAGANGFHGIKLVLDLTTGKFVRLRVDSTTYDLSAYTMPSAADTSDPYLEALIENIGEAATGYVCNVDDLIITQNEP